MLWNKDNQGTKELREYIGFLSPKTTFSTIEPNVKIEEDKLKKLIGNGVYLIAHDHYQSANFGSTDPQYEKLNELVHAIRSPIAYNAYLLFAPSNDLTHDTDGRHIRVNEDLKAAAEWQLERSESAMRDIAFQLIDTLLEFLDLNSDTGQFLSVWKTSTAYQESKSLFFPDAMTFDEYYPIEQSRRIFLITRSFQHQVEKKHILPILGKERFDQLKADLLDEDGLSVEDMTFVRDYIYSPIANLTMAYCLTRLSVKLLPSGVIQKMNEGTRSSRSYKVANTSDRLQVAQELEKEGRMELRNLELYLESIAPEEPIVVEETTEEDTEIDTNQKFFRS